MLSVLRSQLDSDAGQMVLRFDYRNLAPLYADEEMRICVRRNLDHPNKFVVWIEGPEGGYAVKASAEVGLVIPDDTPDTKSVEITKPFDKEPSAGEPTGPLPSLDGRTKRRIDRLVKDLRLLKSYKKNSLEEGRSESEGRQENSEDELSRASRRVQAAIRRRGLENWVYRLATKHEKRAANRDKRRGDELKIRKIGGQDQLGDAQPVGFKARRHARRLKAAMLKARRHAKRIELLKRRTQKRLNLGSVPEAPPKNDKQKLLDLISVLKEESEVRIGPESNRWVWVPPPDEKKD